MFDWSKQTRGTFTHLDADVLVGRDVRRAQGLHDDRADVIDEDGRTLYGVPRLHILEQVRRRLLPAAHLYAATQNNNTLIPVPRFCL